MAEPGRAHDVVQRLLEAEERARSRLDEAERQARQRLRDAADEADRRRREAEEAAERAAEEAARAAREEMASDADAVLARSEAAQRVLAERARGRLDAAVELVVRWVSAADEEPVP